MHKKILRTVVMGGLCNGGLLAAEVPAAAPMPALAVKTEMIASNVSANTIHGWQSCRLVKFAGQLHATAAVIRPNEAPGDMMGADTASLIFRREADGKWQQAAAVKFRSYTWGVGPDGTFWIVGPFGYNDPNTYRTKVPKDLNSFAAVYSQPGASSYLGAGLSAEGNFLLLHAQNNNFAAGTPNAVVAMFYDCASNKWHKSGLATPEGRYGYEGVLLRGKTALAVLQSALQDKAANPVPPHYNWRHVRLARCDDLTQGQWTNRAWLVPKYGDTSLHDLRRGPDGLAYLSYMHRGGSNSYAETTNQPVVHYIARIHDDLRTEVFATGIMPGSSRLLVDSNKTWYVVGRTAAGKNFHLWQLDDQAGFKPVKEYDLPGTAKLDGYVIHTLRPERFGGEDDGDTIHLMSTHHILKADQKTIDSAELWHLSFELPAGRH